MFASHVGRVAVASLAIALCAALTAPATVQAQDTTAGALSAGGMDLHLVEREAGSLAANPTKPFP